MVKLQQQHFDFIAKALKKSQPWGRNQGFISVSETQWLDTIDTFCGMLKQTNENFDEERFRDACINGDTGE